MAVLMLAAVLVAVLAGAGAQCPTPADLRVVNGTRICAELFTDDSPYYDMCCGGKSLIVDCGADVPYVPWEWSGSISSLVVGTRCQLTVWSRAGKNGKMKTFGTGAVPRLQEVRRGLFSNWNNAIRGYYCQCN
ncbi:syncollin [Cygnus olor]|uniref:syncollin n=1 Tax=Cygnus olor TaxID=8869 RepID=UPI001ADDF021|nr:syncollin [Cygnus olor]